jgi:SOS-response transcriptional repressor LexA
MESRCGAGQFFLDPLELPFERSSDFPRSTLSKGDTSNVRRIDCKKRSDPAEDSSLLRDSQEFLVGRAIFEGHNSAGQIPALQDELYRSTYNVPSRKKSDAETAELPSWATLIAKLLKEQGLTQTVFAAKMGITQATVSLWLSGRTRPEPEKFFRMGKLWGNSSFYSEMLLQAQEGLGGAFQVPGLERAVRNELAHGASKGKGVTRDDDSPVVRVPLLKDAAAAGNPRQIEAHQIREHIPLPEFLCPHPDQTVCVPVDGDSMSPILEPGYIVAIDMAQSERKRLHGQMVAARDPEGGVTIKWLRKVGKDEMLIPQHTSKRHQPTIITRFGEQESGWSVVGKVIWWIGMPTS